MQTAFTFTFYFYGFRLQNNVCIILALIFGSCFIPCSPYALQLNRFQMYVCIYCAAQRNDTDAMTMAANATAAFAMAHAYAVAQCIGARMFVIVTSSININDLKSLCYNKNGKYNCIANEPSTTETVSQRITEEKCF